MGSMLWIFYNFIPKLPCLFFLWKIKVQVLVLHFATKQRIGTTFLPLILLDKPRGASFDHIDIFKNVDLASENVKGLSDLNVVEGWITWPFFSTWSPSMIKVSTFET